MTPRRTLEQAGRHPASCHCAHCEAEADALMRGRLMPPPPVSFDDLDDQSIVPTGKTARDMRAHLDVAAGVSLGTRKSTEKVVNQVAQFRCDACGGYGRWFPRNPMSSHPGGPCRKCKGTGKLKTDPETLRKRRLGRQQAQQERRAAYIAAHAAEYAWATARMLRFDFARSMVDAVNQYGEWTSGQLDAIRRCMAKDEQRKAEQAARAPDAQLAGAGFDRMLRAFAQATLSGLKYPKFHVGALTFSPVTAKSKYPAGTLFVKHAALGYLGRIEQGGRFMKVHACGPEQVREIETVCADPLAAAVLHGKQTGRCSCCGRELENEESVRLGIGPICRNKWGL